MYRCDRCGCCTQPKANCKKIVVQKQRVLHPERPRAKKGMIIKNGKKKTVWIADQGGWGDQIVRELKMCHLCAVTWEQENKR